jgi:hypothetical protein
MPAELFLAGAKDGSSVAAIRRRISREQHRAATWPPALAKSISRAPDGLGSIMAGSVIGAALDLIVAYEALSCPRIRCE